MIELSAPRAIPEKLKRQKKKEFIEYIGFFLLSIVSFLYLLLQPFPLDQRKINYYIQCFLGSDNINATITEVIKDPEQKTWWIKNQRAHHFYQYDIKVKFNINGQDIVASYTDHQGYEVGSTLNINYLPLNPKIIFPTNFYNQDKIKVLNKLLYFLGGIFLFLTIGYFYNFYTIITWLLTFKNGEAMEITGGKLITVNESHLNKNIYATYYREYNFKIDEKDQKIVMSIVTLKTKTNHGDKFKHVFIFGKNYSTNIKSKEFIITNNIETPPYFDNESAIVIYKKHSPNSALLYLKDIETYL